MCTLTQTYSILFCLRALTIFQRARYFLLFKWNRHLHITFKQGNVNFDRTSFKEHSILRTDMVVPKFLLGKHG